MKKKNIMIIIGIISFIIIIGGISYSYFVYNKDVGTVSLNTGEISIDFSNTNGDKTLTNVIPLSDNDGKTISDYFDFTVNSTVDFEKIYYEIYILPKSTNTLNTDYLKVYLTDQNDVELKGIRNYNGLSVSEKTNDGKVIYQGVVELNNDQTAKNEIKDFRLRIWLDENYTDQIAKTFEFDVYLYAKNVMEEASAILPICTAVTNESDLHTEICNQSEDYCARNYSLGDTIVFGSIWDGSSALTAGNAFDCDINNNGIIDKVDGKSVERFYYVNDYFDTYTKNYDSNYAVLLFYKNFINNLPSNGMGAYAKASDIVNAGYECSGTDGCNWYGPLTAVNHFPLAGDGTNNTWRSDLLKVTDSVNNTKYRAILACSSSSCTDLSTTTGGGTLPTVFEYKSSSGVTNAARMLTLKEAYSACAGNLGKKCNFFFENTNYSGIASSYGSFLETPSSSSASIAYRINGHVLNFGTKDVSNTSYGVRPAIDVPKNRIAY